MTRFDLVQFIPRDVVTCFDHCPVLTYDPGRVLWWWHVLTLDPALTFDPVLTYDPGHVYGV